MRVCAVEGVWGVAASCGVCVCVCVCGWVGLYRKDRHNIRSIRIECDPSEPFRLTLRAEVAARLVEP